MTVKELITELEKFDGNIEVTIGDDGYAKSVLKVEKVREYLHKEEEETGAEFIVISEDFYGPTIYEYRT
jgi:hypothetical protein